MATKRKIPDHLHKYKKVNLSRDKENPYLVYKCMKPDCNHYMPITLAEGKLCECNRCGDPMVITRRILTALTGGKPMSKPHCPSCTKSRKTADVAAIAEFLTGTPIQTDTDDSED